MSRSVRNVAESVRARLLNIFREAGGTFDLFLRRYASERFLYRLGESPHRDRFVLKGAALLAVWGGSHYRPTRDLDFTSFGDGDEENILRCFREILEVPVVDDGLHFEVATLTAESIRDLAEYEGLRVEFLAHLGQARIPMRIDIGFGDVIVPPASRVEYPALLGDPGPRIRAYPREAVIAEKLHALVTHGERTSRFKDFYDMYLLAKERDFVGERLAAAIEATFGQRGRPIEIEIPVGLSRRFFREPARAGQWRAYLSRSRLDRVPAEFSAVGELLRTFLAPPWTSLTAGEPFRSTWQAGGPWQEPAA